MNYATEILVVVNAKAYYIALFRRRSVFVKRYFRRME